MTEATTTQPAQNLQVVRETVESLAVAFILALLFKAFIAEAFVIPTGSMAPTLMGAHKDIRCEECGYQYQCGASDEYNDVGAGTGKTVIGTTCPLCRKPQIANPKTDANQATFSGDRILVSKLAYAFAQPRRWDVIVFKFIEEARQNYIKRCVGRPNETIRIREGNIYIREASDGKKAAPFEIARKPPHVMNAMLQVLYDSKYVPKSLVKAGMPNQWQPFPAKESSWKVQQSETNWTASVKDVPKGATQTIRYYHRVVEPSIWNAIETNGAFPIAVPPQSSRLITDFTAYNASYVVDSNSRSRIDPDRYTETAGEVIREANRSSYSRRMLENDGMHWTGDLATDIEIKTEKDTDALTLTLVEAGIEHECRIDLKSGTATARVLRDGAPVEAFMTPKQDLVSQATAKTSVRAGGKHRIRFANVDDTLVLWVDGKHVKWDPSGDLQSESYLPLNERTPKTSPNNPLDAAPIAVGIEGGSAEILRARVFRDIYYIAQGNRGQSLSDYPDYNSLLKQSTSAVDNTRYAWDFHKATTDDLGRTMSQDAIHRNALLTNATQWANSPMGTNRQMAQFTMEKDWYFPMGDNSAASSDARTWGHTPERLMIGRAVMVFWPHYWNAPVPFLPNVQRMGLIR